MRLYLISLLDQSISSVQTKLRELVCLAYQDATKVDLLKQGKDLEFFFRRFLLFATRRSIRLLNKTPIHENKGLEQQCQLSKRKKRRAFELTLITN